MFLKKTANNMPAKNPAMPNTKALISGANFDTVLIYYCVLALLVFSATQASNSSASTTRTPTFIT